MTAVQNGTVVQIVGLHESGQGRHCARHAVCGATVQVGEVLKLVCGKIRNDDNQQEKAIGVFKIEQGRCTCLVGFLR